LAAILLVAGGITRLTQWELYQRLRPEYATEVHWVNGGFGQGFPFIDADDPSVYDTLLVKASELL